MANLSRDTATYCKIQPVAPQINNGLPRTGYNAPYYLPLLPNLFAQDHYHLAARFPGNDPGKSNAKCTTRTAGILYQERLRPVLSVMVILTPFTVVLSV